MGLYKNIALFFSFEKIPKEPLEATCIGEIVGVKEEKDYVDKYIFKMISCEQILKSKNKKLIAYIDKEKEYKSGDIVILNGKIQMAEEARNWYGFNNRNYLKQSKIYGIIHVESSEYIKTEKDFHYVLGKIQNSLKESVQKIYSKDYRSVVSKILFGINQNIEEDIKVDFRDAGISHVLAISGLHISYIVIIINFSLRKLINNIKIRNICICIFLFIFLLITGASPSCTRACIMNIMYLIAQNTYRKNNIYISIIFSFFIILFDNIFVIYNVGMWLSFLGTLGIVLFHPFLNMILKIKKEKFSHKIIDIILVSISAQILIWPVVLYYFNTISLIFFISNILISVLIGPIVILGYGSVLFSYFSLSITKIMVFIEELLLQLLFWIADFCSKIPFSVIYIKGTNEFVLIAYYFIICIMLYYYFNNKLKVFRKIVIIKNVLKKCLNNIKNNRKIFFDNIKISINKFVQKKEKYILKYIAIFLVGIISIGLVRNTLNPNLKLYFVDVGQGDCSIIQVEGKNIIIDAGEGNSDSYDYGKNVVFQHLLKLGINKIDYMIFSHMDSDHARWINSYFRKHESRRSIYWCSVRKFLSIGMFIRNSSKERCKINCFRSWNES